jgi:hypothetical protein
VNDFLTVEDAVAQTVAQQIRLRRTSKQKAALAQSHPVYPEAFDAYLEGHYYFERDSDKDTEIAGKYFERATQLDPPMLWLGSSSLGHASSKPSQVLFPGKKVTGLRVKQLSELWR